jgi:PAS domain S-box-containing protein
MTGVSRKARLHGTCAMVPVSFFSAFRYFFPCTGSGGDRRPCLSPLSVGGQERPPLPTAWSLRWAAPALGLLVAGGLLQAKPIPVPFQSEHHAEIWGLEEGFPENSCSGIVLAPDGYLWLSTFRGLVRFNGQEFKPWAPAEMPHLKTTGIITMYRDRRHRIWFSTMEGLVMNDGPTWKRWTEADGWNAPADYVRSFGEGKDGQIIFGRFSGRVMRLEGEHIAELPTPPGIGGAFCAVDQEGPLYVVRTGYAGFFDEGHWSEIQSEPGLKDRALGVAQDRNGNALIVCRSEILRMLNGRAIERVTLSQEVKPFWRLTDDPGGTLWLAAVEAGVYRIRPDGQVKHLLKADGLAHSGSTRFVYADDSGNIWIGSGVGGLARLRPVRFRYLGEPEGLGDREIPSIAPLGDGRVLIAAYGDGILVFDGTNAVRPAPFAGDITTLFRTVLHTRDQAIWVGAQSQGLFRAQGTALTPAATNIFQPGETVSTLFEDSRGRVWAGGEDHVARQENGAFQLVPLPSGVSERRPALFGEMRDGTVLLARRHEIHAYTSNGLQAEPLVRLPSDCRISTLFVDKDDRVWIGTSGNGLSVFNAGRLSWVSADRLPGVAISALAQDELGKLWFGAGRKVIRADPEELCSLAENRTDLASIQTFDRDDGLRELDFPLGTQPSVAKDERGRIWFALIRGAAMIDPASLRLVDRPPKVVVESISFVPHQSRRPVEIPVTERDAFPRLPAGSRLIRISYAALDFAAPRKQRYRVRLGEEAGEWQEMGGETVVSFLELPPGSHTIQIQASGSDGVWNRTGATLTFAIAPFYWQTGWFRSLVAFGLVSLAGGAAWLAANRRTKIAQENLERERRLAEAQARLALVLENTSDFVAFVDASENLLFVNRAGRAMVGLPEARDPRSMRTSTILPPWALGEFSFTALPEAMRAGTWSGESALRHQDGREIPVSQVVVAHRTPGGNLDFISMIARDISAAKRHSMVQDALRGLATSLTAALSPASLGATVAGACRKLFGHDAFFLVLVNERGEVSLGAYMEDTALDETQPNPVPPDIRELSPQVREVLKGTPLLINRDDDSSRKASDSLEPWGHVTRRSLSLMHAPVLWESGVVGVVSVQSYIPHRYGQADVQLLQTLADHCGAAIARMNAETSLRKNEERLRLAMRTALMGSWEIDLETRQLVASPEAEDVYGYLRDTLSGNPGNLTARILSPEVAELRSLLDRLMAGEITEVSHAHRVRLADGSERWLELKGHRPNGNDHAARPRIIGVTTDVTNRKRAELERVRLEEQLLQAQKLEAIGTLAGGIAHDFNNILTAILGNAELGLFDTEPGNPSREYLIKIKQSSHRARELVRRILAFSRPQESNRQPTALPPVIDEVVRLLRSTIPAAVEISAKIAPNVPRVEIDATEFHQILLNLGTNAWHALSSRAGRITFTLDTHVVAAGDPDAPPELSPGRYVRVTVVDNGKGIPADVMPRIFDPFFTTKGPGEGTGLGLSVVHGIVRANEGAIRVTSAPGAGSTFELYFPPATPADTAAPAVARSNETAGQAGRGERILFVDDEDALVQVAEQVLTRSGYQVTLSRRPSHALAVFRANPGAIRLVISDLSMPEMSGVELATELLRIRPDLPIILTTGFLRPGEADEARRIGVREIVEKPNTALDLLPVIARLLHPPPASIPPRPAHS